MSGACCDVGEDPVEPSDAVADENTIAGQIAERDGYCLSRVAKLDARGAGELSGLMVQRSFEQCGRLTTTTRRVSNPIGPCTRFRLHLPGKI
jgi:hypothetical protein